jgi:hypothetical protein
MELGYTAEWLAELRYTDAARIYTDEKQEHYGF